MKRSESLAVLEAVVAITMWALSFILIKTLLDTDHLSSVTLITLRFGIAAVVVLPVLWRNGAYATVTVKDIPRMAVLGAVGVTLHQLLQVAGQGRTSAGMAALCAATSSAFMVILAAVFLHERMRTWQVGGVILALVGGAVVSVSSAPQDGKSAAIGNVLVLLSAVIWAVAGIMGKKMMRKRESVVVTAGLLLFGFLITLPFFIAQQGWREIPAMTSAAWGKLIALGVLSTAVAHLANNHALKTISAQRVAVIQNLEPFIAVLGAWAILGESMSVASAVGGVAIVAGVYLTERFAVSKVE